MLIGGDQVESIDLGRYVHSFDFNAAYELGFEDGVDDEGDMNIFDLFNGTWIVGQDDDDNDTTFEADIKNLYEGPAIP
jgi:hypothetical protein